MSYCDTAWLLPFAVIGLPAGLAIYMAVAFGVARMLWRRGPSRILALAIAVTVSEWIRGHAFTGFPWNAFGYALTERLVAKAILFRRTEKIVQQQAFGGYRANIVAYSIAIGASSAKRRR